VKDGYIIWKV